MYNYEVKPRLVKSSKVVEVVSFVGLPEPCLEFLHFLSVKICKFWKKNFLQNKLKKKL